MEYVLQTKEFTLSELPEYFREQNIEAEDLSEEEMNMVIINPQGKKEPARSITIAFLDMLPETKMTHVGFGELDKDYHYCFVTGVPHYVVVIVTGLLYGVVVSNAGLLVFKRKRLK